MNKSEKFWDKQAKGFTDHEQHTQLSENKDYITTLKYLNINDTVLDYGCATGIISNAIADKVKEIHAIDISPKMIEIAKSKASERNIENIHYAPATIFDERYQKESFNVILAFRILHMLEDIDAVITTDIGFLAFETFEQCGIKIYQAKGKIKHAIQQFEEGKLPEITKATVPRYSGLKLRKMEKEIEKQTRSF